MKKNMKWLICLLTAAALMIQMALPLVPASAEDASRDTVLVLDDSGSMQGDPVVALREAALQFCESMLSSGGGNRVAIVSYSYGAYVLCDFTDDLTTVEDTLYRLEAYGSTNMYEGLNQAAALLDNSTAKTKNIVLMTDGLPNEGEWSYDGRYSWDDYSDYYYANEVYNLAVSLHPSCYIYTLGFFHNLEDYEKDFAVRFLRDLENGGYYEVESEEGLKFTFGEVAEDITSDKLTGTFRYASGSERDYEATYYFEDAYFLSDSFEYNPSLATMSLCLALSAFGSNESVNGYEDKSRNVEDLMGQLGFEDFDTNAAFRRKPDADSIAVAVGHKQITDGAGTEYTLLAVAVRGGGYEQEWASNFTIGEQLRHKGFNDAATEVLSFIGDYLSSHPEIQGDVKMWITGYSRAAATSNLVAATVDVEPELASGVTVRRSNLFAYCFETPAGTTDSDGGDFSTYGNIFNIVNPNDLVTKVAPAAMRFRRYGVDKVLPTRENRYNAYDTLSAVMLDKYYALESTPTYVLDRFTPQQMKLSRILPGGESPIQEATNNRQSMGAFLDGFFTRLINGYLSRNSFVTQLQEGVRELCKAMFKDESKVQPALDRTMEKIKDNALSLIWKYAWDEYGTYEIVAGYLVESLRAEGVTDFDENEVKQAAKPLLDKLLAYLSNNLDDLATLIGNGSLFATAHYPELCLAWMQAQDPNYNATDDEVFVPGKYRVIRINCPVDVDVFDELGTLVASFVSGEAVAVPNSSISAMTNSAGEKLIYLPPDSGFSLAIRATDSGTVTYSVDEFSYGMGDISRVVSFFDIPVNAGDILNAVVPAYAVQYMDSALDTATDTVYQLFDAMGNALIPNLDLAVDVPGGLSRFVNALSEDPLKGIVTGGGAFTIGDFAMLSAVPAENCEFLGWYTGDGRQVSTETDYRFCVREDTELIARFSNTASGVGPIVGLIAALVLLLFIIPGVILAAILVQTRNSSQKYAQVSNQTSVKDQGAIQLLSDARRQVMPVRDGRTLMVGRDPSQADFVLSGGYGHVSRIHCSVTYSAMQQCYIVVDRSSNGTYLQNGRGLNPGERTVLKPGTVLQLGDADCRILLM